MAVVLADHHNGDLIAWSDLSPSLHPRDLSLTRTGEILALAGLLHDDRLASFTTLTQTRLAALPPTIATDVQDWLTTRHHGGPAAAPATSTPSG